MRILCVAAAYPPYGKGGGPQGSENLAKALQARGHSVRVLTVAGQEAFEVRDGIQIKTLRSLNVYWNYWIKHAAPLKLIWHVLENFNPRAFWRMRSEIIAFRPDIVVTVSIENVNVATWVRRMDARVSFRTRDTELFSHVLERNHVLQEQELRPALPAMRRPHR